MNGEIKRHIEVAGIYPNEPGIRHLVGTILLDQRGGSISRDYATLWDTIGGCCCPAVVSQSLFGRLKIAYNVERVLPMHLMPDVTPSKDEKNENFPVASWYLSAKNREAILKFYRFVRKADDVADSSKLSASQKISIIDCMERELLGDGESVPEAASLRDVLSRRSITVRHAQDLLKAFRLDVTKSRYETWDDLLNYCSFSAMPAGRFLLDLHDEDQKLWPLSDRLCTALQINNHLQDCRKDYTKLDRVYLPTEFMNSHGATVEMLSSEVYSPNLLACLRSIAVKNDEIIDSSRLLGRSINNVRLGAEVSIVHAYAKKISGMLLGRNSVNQRVHLSKGEAFALTLRTVAVFLFMKTQDRSVM